MKSCSDFFLKKKKRINKRNEIDNLNASSSKLKINKTPIIYIKENKYDKNNNYIENLERNTLSSVINKKNSKSNYI